ncbi:MULTISPECIES: TauD/TfdA dioxygenase family protein [Protofrankia]|uniref:Taurine catabolism dioxygenase TauD/TfdA n=1 Tax=Candidatus Protofrankia datiscae TaxID=2716812 RepID=F8B2Q6_9ACTN|nr:MULTISPECIES: TauD/TfdA family dioxygenase [Protofrankia]AEH07776.1 Taurine catabolism dioxygenase TauD/TfdA [Candidatus Protofrankia datiscae]
MTFDPTAVTKLGPPAGAEIHNLDLRVPLSRGELAALTELLDVHKLLLFRGQSLDSQRYVGFCRNFGSVVLSWPAGDVAIWDNRVLLHYGVRGHGSFPRELERVLVARPSPLVEKLV